MCRGMVNACNQTRHYGAQEAEELAPEIITAFSSVIPEVFSPGSILFHYAPCAMRHAVERRTNDENECADD